MSLNPIGIVPGEPTCQCVVLIKIDFYHTVFVITRQQCSVLHYHQGNPQIEADTLRKIVLL